MQVWNRVADCCTTCGGAVDECGLKFEHGGGCCSECLGRYRACDGTPQKRKNLIMNKAAYWVSDTQWVCPKHIPSARLPESEGACWYNCGTTRPAKTTPVPRKRPEVVVPLPFPLRELYAVEATPPPPPKPSSKASAPTSLKLVEPRLLHLMQDMAAIPVPAPAPLPPPPEPEMIEVVVVVAAAEEEGPSPQEKRRGATHKVACLECGATLWRRKKDVEEGTKPFCTPAHRGAYEARARVR